MKNLVILVIGCLISFFIGAPVSAQFYAPDTEYHDKAQRLFPVEAARVLAWRENLAGGQIAEITFKISTEKKPGHRLGSEMAR